MNKQNVEVLSDLIVFSQKFQTDLMIAKREGVRIANINVLTNEEQEKLDKAVEILKEACERTINIVLNK